MLWEGCWPETGGQKETQVVHPKPGTLAVPGAEGPGSSFLPQGPPAGLCRTSGLQS